MYIVYLLQSINFPDQYYIGFTNNLERRLEEHNSGLSVHTNKHKPWKVQTYIVFSEEKKAQLFEKYLKNGSGRIFSLRYF